ncbi:MAG TPA: hypothetical protein VMU80_17395 [Bryobacteraceae bacterium]|nr:hypothetical protein [Bryobacteraceae bacterium]
MFDTLDARFKQDDAAEISTKERIMKVAAIVVISIALFSGLYFAVKFLQ